MSTLGVNKAWLAVVDQNKSGVITGKDGIFGDETDKVGVFQLDDQTAKGLVSFALSNMAGSQTDIYGSNKIVWISQGKAAPQGILTANAIPYDILNRILGRKEKGNGGYEAAGQNKNYIAVLVESSEAFDIEKPLYVGFYSGLAQMATENMQTNNATDQRVQDAITIKAAERGDDGFGAYYYSEEAAFTQKNMFDDFFPGADTSTMITDGSGDKGSDGGETAKLKAKSK